MGGHAPQHPRREPRTRQVADDARHEAQHSQLDEHHSPYLSRGGSDSTEEGERTASLGHGEATAAAKTKRALRMRSPPTCEAELFEVPCIGCRAQILGFPAALARPDGEAVPDRGAHPGGNHRRSHPRVGDDTDEIGLPGVAVEGCCLDRSEEHRAVLSWIPLGAAGNPNDSERWQVLSGQPDRFPDPEIERRGQTRADDDLRRALGDVALSHHERRQALRFATRAP